MAMVALLRLMLLFFLLCCPTIQFASSFTHPNDDAVLLSLRSQWQNTPPSWKTSDDPCGGSWEGVTCNNQSRVVALSLSSMELIGALTGDIGQLSELTSLDLSFNPGLTGPVSPRLGDLKKLNILIFEGCGFSGNIPPELGNLTELHFLTLNDNNFTGEIPNSIGYLSKLFWLDLAHNQLSGSIPVSTPSEPGLDHLFKAKHFYFNKNNLSGSIPSQLFHTDMTLINVLLDGNQLTGSIPSTLGLVKTLEVVRLDRNSLTGVVPSNLNNLTSVTKLNLAHNKLTGPIPNLTGMNSLNFVDLSNNSFEKSEAPEWFSTLPSLITLVMEYGQLHGPVPQTLFSGSLIQQVKLKNNAFNGTLDMGDSVSQQLVLVDFEGNEISDVRVGQVYQNTLKLTGNPVCTSPHSANTDYCQLQWPIGKPYSTSLSMCGNKLCPEGQKLSPLSCDCAYPYNGILFFRAASFRELCIPTRFHELETKLCQYLALKNGSALLHNLEFDSDDYLNVYVDLFPSSGIHFTWSEVQDIGACLANHTFTPSDVFGPYCFYALPYEFADVKRGGSLNLRLISGIAAACTLLGLLFVGLGSYAIKQKSRAERALSLSRPFVSWGSSGKYNGDAPQLKGAICFPYHELKNCTNNFSDCNEIGAGGYGKVYRGVLSNGQQVAIKRSMKASKQGGHEFKTEIELLSRVHHKNLVSLLGFCVEQGERMLVYEYMPNGSLKDCLSGKSGIYLDWTMRLCVALDSARGIAYLHDHANPSIVHRDIKSTNILLDENLIAKVADFGLCKLIPDSAKGYVTTQVKGTLGYLDPEYYETQQLTEKSDVYSFGVLMLELITGKQPVEMGRYVVREAKASINDNDKQFWGLLEMIDPNLQDLPNLQGFRKFLELAMNCLKDTAPERPKMSNVVNEMEMLLQNNEVDTSSTSASSSFTNFEPRRDAPYDVLLRKMTGTDVDVFEYSDGYTVSSNIGPK